MNQAVVVIDLLQDFFKEGRLEKHKDRLIKNVNSLTALARTQSIPVIWVRQEFTPDLHDAFLAIRRGVSKPVTIQGTAGAKLLSGLVVAPKDHEIIKKRYSAFFGTQLDDLLHSMDIKRLIIAGVNSHACVRMAVIDAYQRDYSIFLATDCVDSYDKEHHDISLRYLTRTMSEPMTNAQLHILLGKGGPEEPVAIQIETNMDAATRIIKHAGQWMRDRKVGNYSKWWDPDRISTELLGHYAKPNEFYVVRVNGQAAAAAILQTEQSLQDWGSIDRDTVPPLAVYLHYVAVERNFAGHGLVGMLVETAEQLARQNHAGVLRLDTNAQEPKLCSLYEGLGFERVGTAQEGDHLTAFYEKVVGPSSGLGFATMTV
jgi:nicotinamidase-related amidase/ribosomal protein S18 acetylase RimI-like enzyme